MEWKDSVAPTELKSEQEITSALQDGKLTIQPTNNVVNCPVIKWVGGLLMERSNKNLADESPYGPGQVLEVNTEKVQATFVGLRGFAPDGWTIYHIATDASNQDVANALGVMFVNKTRAVILSGDHRISTYLLMVSKVRN